MNITETERLILANQYKILTELAVNKKDGSKEIYNQLFEVFNNGYTSNYDDITSDNDYFVYDENLLDDEGQLEVRNLISMYQYIIDKYESAKKVYDNLPEIRFTGYDLNSPYEVKKLSYMNFIFDTLGRYPDVKSAFDDKNERNSHGDTSFHDGMLAKYVDLHEYEDFYDDSDKYVKEILEAK